MRFPRGNYPLARKGTHRGGVTVSCRHCSEQIKLSRWESWNGFLVRCPYCDQINGKAWRAKPIIWGSILFNAFSFLFTTRPLKALILIFLFAGIAITGNYLGLSDTGSPLLDVASVSLFFFSPAMINAVLILRHNEILRESQPMIKNVVDLAEEVVQGFIQ